MFKQLWKALGFHVHDWSIWERLGRYFDSASPNKSTVAYGFERKCKTCGLVQYRKQWL